MHGLFTRAKNFSFHRLINETTTESKRLEKTDLTDIVKAVKLIQVNAYKILTLYNGEK
jgi:GDP-D-mannose dehydratase